MSVPASSPPSRLISDELWALVEPLIPPQPPAVLGRTGRPRTSDRDVLEGIAFVLSDVQGRAAARTAGQRCRVALAGDEETIMARPETVNASLTTTESLISASSSSTRCFSAVR